MKAFPRQVLELHALERLSLAHNQLESLDPASAQLGRLLELNLDHNQLMQLPEEAGNFNNLNVRTQNPKPQTPNPKP